ncbi:MAG: hypothetical protein O3A92_15695 [Verrucomicrobia bacterium]|nr:hypothetical protein [Verrucomicrobiota bacterium]
MNAKETDHAAALLTESFDRLSREGAPGQLTEIMNPDVAIEALFLRASGMTVAEVKRKTGLHHVTLQGLEDRHREVLKVLRRRTANATAATAAKAVELTARKLQLLDDDPEALAKTGIKDVCLSAAILIDKARLLAGEATEVHEIRRAFSFEEYREFLRKAQGRVLDAEEVSGTIGSGASERKGNAGASGA